MVSSYTVVVAGKASDYAQTCGYPACYIDGYGTVVQIPARSEEEAGELGFKFGRVKSVYLEQNQKRGEA